MDRGMHVCLYEHLVCRRLWAPLRHPTVTALHPISRAQIDPGRPQLRRRRVTQRVPPLPNLLLCPAADG